MDPEEYQKTKAEDELLDLLERLLLSDKFVDKLVQELLNAAVKFPPEPISSIDWMNPATLEDIRTKPFDDEDEAAEQESKL